MIECLTLNGIFSKNSKSDQMFAQFHQQQATYELGDKLYIGSEVKNDDNIETMMKRRINPNARLDCP
jgi:hypothetical protein